MKKILLIGLMLLVITGCNSEESNDNNTNSTTSTLSCTTSYSENDNEVTETMIVTYEDGYVTRVENTSITEYSDADTMQMTYAFGQLFAAAFEEIDGISANYSEESDTSLKYTITVDYNSLDVDALKDVLGDSFDESLFYTKSSITIDEFKTEYLDGYTCN